MEHTIRKNLSDEINGVVDIVTKDDKTYIVISSCCRVIKIKGNFITRYIGAKKRVVRFSDEEEMMDAIMVSLDYSGNTAGMLAYVYHPVHSMIALAIKNKQ